ncbi:Hint domain-containing protein [Litorivita sp. NS0012-18]|uniref:Hint domain-containing protein n=1 Tax=Litorivita sp. NS0012-18 TaxID=3127655 RepID=UPI00310BE60D
MTQTAPDIAKPAQSLPVFRSGALCVSHGVNMGEGISFAAELMLDDTYQIAEAAALERLSIIASDEGPFRIASGTVLGAEGAALHLDCCITLMDFDGSTTEVIVLVEVDEAGDINEIYALPLAPLAAKRDYRLVGINTDNTRAKFAEVACSSFARGTHITLASGAQVPIEALTVGDMVLTRDDGPQPIRWIGQTTVRAVGEFAPIVIAAGTLNNENDLTLSPDHRLFIYQRSDQLGAGRSELLVKARHLVNGDSVIRQDGGFVDYFQLLFDRHQIVYAEGIAAETLLVDMRTRPALPEGLTDKLLGPNHAASGLSGLEVSETLLDRPDAAEILRRASTR